MALWPKGLTAENEPMKIPCGGCINCRAQDRLQWALRCRLEAQLYTNNTFATLTFNDENLPPSLELRHLQLFYKKLRKELAKQQRKLRHFSCGEYGDKTHRPHYHAILFGLHHEKDKHLIEGAWTTNDPKQHVPLGHVRLGPADIGGIHYIVGYEVKKLGQANHEELEHVDETTGEITALKPPFRTMSKKPGLGKTHAEEHIHAWRTHAVLDGKTIATPRYLRNLWKKLATAEEQEQVTHEQHQRHITQNETRTREQETTAHALAIEIQRDRDAQEENHTARLAASAAKRQLD